MVRALAAIALDTQAAQRAALFASVQVLDCAARVYSAPFSSSGGLVSRFPRPSEGSPSFAKWGG
jgi:hypothetical protein